MRDAPGVPPYNRGSGSWSAGSPLPCTGVPAPCQPLPWLSPGGPRCLCRRRGRGCVALGVGSTPLLRGSRRAASPQYHCRHRGQPSSRLFQRRFCCGSHRGVFCCAVHVKCTRWLSFVIALDLVKSSCQYKMGVRY